MKTQRWILVLLLALAGVPAAAQAQPAEQRIEAARRQALTAGIPVSLLESKVAEGRAKGVPMDRIAAVVERRLASLSSARDAMAAAPRTAPITAADLSVGADALEAGVQPGVLGQLTVTAPGDHRAMAIAALTQLVSQGESSERALARWLAEDGADGHDLAVASTWSAVVERANVGELEVEVDALNTYTLTGLADDIVEGTLAVDAAQLELATELLLDVGEWAGDEEPRRALAENQPLGWLVSFVVRPDPTRLAPSPPFDAEAAQFRTLVTELTDRLRRP